MLVSLLLAALRTVPQGGVGGEICGECARFRARDFFEAFIKWSRRVDWRGADLELSRELAGEFLRELVSDFV